MRLTERSVSSSYRMALTVLLVLATSTVLGQPQPEAAPPAPPADPQLVDPATTAEAPVVEPDESASWLYNPNERTRFAIDALEAGAPKAAAEALDTALVLRGDDDPVAQYNAGTGRLLAGRTDAAPLLEAAAELVPETLGSRAHYNLGNARLAADDAQGAIDAYQRALRADPELADAK
ncbi:MAG: tetratricopeptide repeat protein [Acidobacteriota bacterium]